MAPLIIVGRGEQQRRRRQPGAGSSSSFLPLLLALLLLAATGAEALRLAAMGDWGDGSTTETSVANLIKSWSPDHVLALGDNNYAYGYLSDYPAHVGRDYSTFIDNTSDPAWGGKPSSADGKNHLWPVPGNHDWGQPCGDYKGGCTASTCPGGDLSPYLRLMPVGGKRYYNQTLGNGLVEIFALDSDCSEPDGTGISSTQALWLQAKLAASTATWKIVMLHHSPFSSGTGHGSITRVQWPFGTWGAHVVLSGHDHVYERIQQPGGIPYVVNGIGGAGLNSFGAPVSGSQVRYANNWGAVRIDVNTTTMRFELYSITPTLRDCFVISKSAGGAVSYPNCDGSSNNNTTPTPPPTTPTYSLLTGATFVDQGVGRPHFPWRYTSTNAIAAGWNTTAFDASAWPRGLTAFGYGADLGYAGGYATSLPDARVTNPILNHYFRTSFCLSAARLAWLRTQASVALKVAADNGADVYLNGVKLSSDSAANHDVLYWNNVVNVPGTSPAFVQGPNWLAVYVSNTVSSSDAAFDLDIAYTASAPQKEVPSAPTGVAATATGRTTMRVAFTKPACDGSSFITSYNITAYKNGSTNKGTTTVAVTDPFATSITKVVGSLQRCTSYTFTVKALNAAGASVGATSALAQTTCARRHRV